MARKLRIIFFIPQPAPSAQELEIANDLTDMTHTVAFRNCVGVDANDTIEAADFYCGAIPAVYRDRMLSGKNAKAKEIDLATRKVKDAAAPVATSQGSEADAKATERAKVDEWAKTAKVEELKQGLAHYGIAFEPDAKKADLLQLFLSRP